MLINDNPLTCDCRDYDVIAKLRIFTRSHWLDGVDCNLPAQLANDKVSAVQRGSIYHWVQANDFEMFTTREAAW